MRRRPILPARRRVGSDAVQLEGQVWRPLREAKRLRALEDENARLKRLLAEAMLDNAGLKDLLSKNGNARRQARHGCPSPGGAWDERAVGVQGHCGGSDEHALSLDDSDLREKLRALAQERRRFGYRRLHILLRRDDAVINRKKTQRLYREEGLTVRRRKAANARLERGHRHRFRVLNIVDDVTRECPSCGA